MGIQGLLPLLKPIQRHRHLSELAGQTIAVDAYVWLHRGAYGCAAELVQGRPTRRYVDFCMARVRLLRHHGIEPYLVFDGGPLPAKLGTEKEREKKRAENIKRANELAKQGKGNQARDFFVKCVDVTPQMAYQVIKALKAENVPFIVAPYEADAQLAYLERTGLVDGILTEDSDLLVFGCRNVHFKLDTVSASIISIYRTDFGSPSLAAESFSLIGWSDTQFRRMAMLSGCDYLPSISGVGLKTAYQLLKKYKNVERAVKMIRLEGKKDVPIGYLDEFYLAEKVFLHQRVFDPRSQELVYLTDPIDGIVLSAEDEFYIGRHLEQTLAIRIAEGNACPISLTSIEDINACFAPRNPKALPLQSRDTNNTRTPKGKEPAIKKGGILNFFTPVSKSPEKLRSPRSMPIQQTPIPETKVQRGQSHAVAGYSSGKRTLVDVMEHDMAAKRKKVADEYEHHRKSLSTSRFFTTPSHHIERKSPTNSFGSEKENDRSASDTENKFWEHVEQEDGYLSPSPSLSRKATPDLSSPILERVGLVSPQLEGNEISPDFKERILVRGSSEPLPDEDSHDCRTLGPDLRDVLAENSDDLDVDTVSEASSEIKGWDEDFVYQLAENFPLPGSGRPSPSPLGAKDRPARTKPRTGLLRTASIDERTDELEQLEIDEEDVWEEEQSSVQARLARKWKAKYSLGHTVDIRSMRSDATESHFSSKPLECLNNAEKLATTVSILPNPAPGLRGKLEPGRFDKPQSIQRSLHLSSRTGTRSSPITIDFEDAADEVAPNSGGRLQAFRFSL